MEQKRKILPPVYLLAALGAMAALHYTAPLLKFIPSPWRYAGVLLIAAGVAVAITAALSFKRAGTAVIPFEPSTALVTDGLYNITRNPMYLGMILVLGGAALLFGSLSAWIPVPLFYWIINTNFIRGEERFLEEIFGEQYMQYKRKVRRWL
ncbi:MAG TPA: isoprenylcysteine carboxylmethyltransferase family protein [Gammaproteobacteria bacterium]